MASMIAEEEPPGTLPHPRRVRSRVLAAVLLLVAAGAGWWVYASGQPRQAPLPSLTAGFEPVCGSSPGTIFPQAPAYGRAGPHPSVVFVSFGEGGPGNIPDIGSSESMTLPWGTAAVPAQTQLAACAVQVWAASRPLTTCAYQQIPAGALAPAGPPNGLSMYRATYQVTLREIRTGRVVANARLAGDDTSCPFSVGQFATAVYSWPSAQQWRHAFGGYVAGSAR
jgi:hypothetical protein